jgi:hypothetical protein
MQFRRNRPAGPAGTAGPTGPTGSKGATGPAGTGVVGGGIGGGIRKNSFNMSLYAQATSLECALACRYGATLLVRGDPPDRDALIPQARDAVAPSDLAWRFGRSMPAGDSHRKPI